MIKTQNWRHKDKHKAGAKAGCRSMFGLQGFRKNYMDPHVLSKIANPDPVVDKKTFQNNLFQGFDSQRAWDLTAPSGSRPECPQNEKSLQNVQ